MSVNSENFKLISLCCCYYLNNNFFNKFRFFKIKIWWKDLLQHSIIESAYLNLQLSRFQTNVYLLIN